MSTHKILQADSYSSSISFFTFAIATYTTTQAGAWSSASTWGGSGVPGNTDTAVITYAVTLASAVTVGTSPAVATTDAVTINNNGTSTNGTLTIQSGGILTLRGRLTAAGTSSGIAFLKVEPGGGVVVDSTQATAQTNYIMRMTGTSDYFWFAGTSGGTRPYITALNDPMPNVGGTPAALPCRITSGFSGNPRFIATYSTFTRVGSTSTLYAISGPCYPDISYCRFDTCGTIYIAGLPATVTLNIQSSTWVNSVAAPVIVTAANTLNTSGTRAIQRCVFDTGIAAAATDVIMNNNIVCGYNANAGVSQTGGLGLISDTLFILPQSTSGGGYFQRYLNCYILGVYQATNARFSLTSNVVTNTDVDASTPTFDRLIFDYPNTSSVAYDGGVVAGGDLGDSGDLIQTPSSNPASAITTTIANSIALPISSGHPADSYASRGIYPGTMFTGRGHANTIMRSYHNTWFSYDGSATRGSHGVINVAESTTSTVATVTLFRDNLCWSNLTSGMPMTLDTSATTNAVTPSGVYNNASYNLITHSQSGSANGKTYFGTSSGTIGANDIVNSDPGFVDSTRCFVKWVRTLRGDLGSGSSNGAGSYTGATYTDEQTIAFGIAELKKLNDADFDSRYTRAALTAYVREGFKVTNASFRSGSSDTGTIGGANYHKSTRSTTKLSALRTAINTRYGISV
ncbi:MAG: hypothetical protein KBD00_00455 [Candidatus Peribacteraceae bacterium]|nr:hypothetical protein [Candidatus Peribacteraceae bacterium]